MNNIKSLEEFKQDSINEGWFGSLLSWIPGTNAKAIKKLTDEVIALHLKSLEVAYNHKDDYDLLKSNGGDISALSKAQKNKIDAIKGQISALEDKIENLADNSGDETQKFNDMMKIRIKLEVSKAKEKWADKEELRSLKSKQQELQKQANTVQKTDSKSYSSRRPSFMDDDDDDDDDDF